MARMSSFFMDEDELNRFSFDEELSKNLHSKSESSLGRSYVQSRSCSNQDEEESDGGFSTDLEDVEDYLRLNCDQKASYHIIFDGCCKKVYEAACKRVNISPDHHAMTHLDKSSILIPNRSMNCIEVGALMEAMINNSCVEELDLSGNFLDDESCRYIANMLAQNGFIARVDISCNKIREGFGVFHRVFEQGGFGLKQLVVSNNEISEKALLQVAPTLSTNTCLAVLDLSSSSIVQTKAVLQLLNALKTNHTLTVLDLSNNLIGTAEVIDAIGVLNKHNKHLRYLSLASIRLHPSAVEKLHKAFIRTYIECLNLADNHIEAEQLKKFSNNLTRPACKLKGLFLDNNSITDDVFNTYIKVLSKSRQLKVLSLVGYKNDRSLIATGDTLVLYNHGNLLKDLQSYFTKNSIDPVALFVRNTEKTNIAASANASIKYNEVAVRENLKRLFVKLPPYMVERYLASLGFGDLLNYDNFIDCRCKNTIHNLELKLKQEIRWLRPSDVSFFMLNLLKYGLYAQVADVKPLIRKERFWLENKSIHCLVLDKLLECVDPQFRNLTLKDLMLAVELQRANDDTDDDGDDYFSSISGSSHSGVYHCAFDDRGDSKSKVMTESVMKSEFGGRNFTKSDMFLSPRCLDVVTERISKEEDSAEFLLT